MMKSIIAALLITTATPGIVLAQDSELTSTEASVASPVANELDEMMSMISKIFDTSKLPPPEPARMKLAELTAAKLLPDGTYTKIINDMIAQFMTPLFNIMPGLSNDQIMVTTGSSTETVAALSEADKAAVTQLIDPDHKDRGERTLSIIRPIIAEVMAIIEPAMRTGLTLAYARKFNASELVAINGFFATQAGTAFARESLALQADPEVLQATFKAIPAIITKFSGDQSRLKASFDALPKRRSLSDLSDDELQKLSGLLGVTVQSLEDYRSMSMTTDSSLPPCAADGDASDCTDADWAASEAASAAAASAVAAAEATALERETQRLRSVWSKADRRAVEQAETRQAELSAQHQKIDAEMNEAAARLQSVIDTAKQNAGQTVEEEIHNDGADQSDSDSTAMTAVAVNQEPEI